MNYAKRMWNNTPSLAKAVLGVAFVWGTMINVGNAMIAKQELDKGYTPIQADENIKSRFGQFYPCSYDEATYAIGALGRKIVYVASD